MDTLLQDVRTAIRRMRKAPLFATIVVATLAIGIGASTALFSIVHAVLIRPLPYAHSERLAFVWGTMPGDSQLSASYPEYLDWRSGNRTFDAMAVFRGQSVNYTGGVEPDRLIGSFVSSNFLDLLGMRTILGRGFLDGESDPSSAKPVALLSRAAFASRFASDPGVVGRSLTINGQPFTIVGVVGPEMDPGRAPFDGWFMGTEVWLPLAYFPNARGLERGQNELMVVGRLKEGVAPATAMADLGTIAARLEQAFPATNTGRGANVVPLAEQIVGVTRPALLTALAAALGVLLIGCLNVANLFLAQTASRGHELATRAALGAGSRRLIRLQLTEGVLYGLLGGGLGIVLAVVGREALVASLPFPTSVPNDGRVQGAVLLFCLAVSTLAGLVVSVVPAWQMSRGRVALALRQGSRALAESRAPRRTREWLVVGELALSLALLAGAGLLLRSANALGRVTPGFRSERLLTMMFRLPPSKYAEPPQIARFFEAALDRIRAVPGVESAALARTVPFAGNVGPERPFALEGAVDVPEPQRPRAQTNIVSPDYFKTMGIPLLRGREFAHTDTLETTKVAIVSRLFADRMWPVRDPLGRQVRFGDDPWLTVIGVVGDVKHGTLVDRAVPQAYTAHLQDPRIFSELAVRTTGDPLALASAVRQAIWSVDPDQPVWRIRSVGGLLDEARQPARNTAFLAAASAATALVLSVLGLYGVLSYLVGQRSREIGVRIALGADRHSVQGLVLRHALGLAAVGVALGVVAGLAWARALRSLLFGIAPADPATFAAVAALLLAVTFIASYLPARRAAGVDPAHVLRAE